MLKLVASGPFHHHFTLKAFPNLNYCFFRESIFSKTNDNEIGVKDEKTLIYNITISLFETQKGFIQPLKYKSIL